jgi:hypothetical protein
MCLFSDETGVFEYEVRKIFSTGEIKVGHYYECLCKLTLMNASWVPDILNLKPIEGNLITAHIAKVITQEIQNKISSNAQVQTGN